MKTLNDFPEWVESNDKLTELKHQFSDIDREIHEALHSMQNHERQFDRLESEALVMLDGGQAVTVRTVSTTDYETLNEKRKVIRKAIQLQEGRIAQLRSELSRKICEQVKPEYAGIVKEMAKVAGRLQGLLEIEFIFRRSLQDADIAFANHLPPCFVRGLGHEKRDEYSRINQFFREAVEAGYLKQSEPEVFSR